MQKEKGNEQNAKQNKTKQTTPQKKIDKSAPWYSSAKKTEP